jgi:hypothetical protein
MKDIQMTKAHPSSDRRHFIGGSDARVIMGKDEKRFCDCGAKSAARRQPLTFQVS